MAALVTGEKARMYALSKIERSGATRSGYTSPTIFVTIAGVQVAANRAVPTNLIQQDTLTITERAGETPNTASFTVRGFVPTDGQDVVITRGSQNRTGREFAGTILTDAHGYIGTPANGNDQISVVDYTWQLTRETITQRWTNVSGTVIAQAIIAHAGRGFTATMVAAGLAVLDEFTVTNQTHAQALTSLCGRLGTTWKATYLKEVQFGLVADPAQTDPTPITAASALLTGMTAFSVTRDLSQVITRQPAEGGGGASLADCAVGETQIPVSELSWYNAAGGTVVSGPQRLTYTGKTQASPTTAPMVTPTTGTGLTDHGRYGYGYSFVTAAGETLPSLLGTFNYGGYTTFTLATPASAPTNVRNNPGSGTGTVVQQTAGATYTYGVTYVRDASGGLAGETVLGPTVSHVAVAWLGGPDCVGIEFDIPNPNDSVTTLVNIYRQKNAGPFVLLFSVGAGTITVGDIKPDSWTGVAPPSVSTAVFDQVNVSSIPPGPPGTTARKLYRTVNGGSALFLQQTIADNTTTFGVTDSTPDGSLGAAALTADTSGLVLAAVSTTSGATAAGATSLVLVSGAAFLSAGGWVNVAGITVRYTGKSTNTLTGIPASGAGSITAALPAASTVTSLATLLGVPASGAGSILYPVKQGDPVNVRVVVDDLTAQAVIGALMLPTVDDGIIEGALIQDGRSSETEVRSRATAALALHSQIEVAINLTGQDTNLHAGRTQAVNLVVPPVVGSFKLQSVTQTNFQPAIYPQRTCVGAVALVTLSDLFRILKGG